jgi:hypothetical protein
MRGKRKKEESVRDERKKRGGSEKKQKEGKREIFDRTISVHLMVDYQRRLPDNPIYLFFLFFYFLIRV